MSGVASFILVLPSAHMTAWDTKTNWGGNEISNDQSGESWRHQDQWFHSKVPHPLGITQFTWFWLVPRISRSSTDGMNRMQAGHYKSNFCSSNEPSTWKLSCPLNRLKQNKRKSNACLRKRSAGWHPVTQFTVLLSLQREYCRVVTNPGAAAECIPRNFVFVFFCQHGVAIRMVTGEGALNTFAGGWSFRPEMAPNRRRWVPPPCELAWCNTQMFRNVSNPKVEAQNKPKIPPAYAGALTPYAV